MKKRLWITAARGCQLALANVRLIRNIRQMPLRRNGNRQGNEGGWQNCIRPYTGC